MAILPGRISLLVVTLFLGALVYAGIKLCQAGKWTPNIRRLAGLDAIEEAIGRATEMGAPVHYTPGIGGIDAQLFASFEILSYVTEMTAKYNTEIIVTIRTATVFPLAQESVRQGYMAAGRPDMFQEETVQFLSSEQFAYAAAVLGIMNRRKVAANLMFGVFLAESLLLAEAGSQIGAIQVAGTASMTQLPFFVAACDYTLLGEEIYAAGAYLSQDKIKVGSIGAQDIAKAICMFIVLVGSLLATADMNIFIDMLKK